MKILKSMLWCVSMMVLLWSRDSHGVVGGGTFPLPAAPAAGEPGAFPPPEMRIKRLDWGSVPTTGPLIVRSSFDYLTRQSELIYAEADLDCRSTQNGFQFTSPVTWTATDGVGNNVLGSIIIRVPGIEGMVAFHPPANAKPGDRYSVTAATANSSASLEIKITSMDTDSDNNGLVEPAVDDLVENTQAKRLTVGGERAEVRMTLPALAEVKIPHHSDVDQDGCIEEQLVNEVRIRLSWTAGPLRLWSAQTGGTEIENGRAYALAEFPATDTVWAEGVANGATDLTLDLFNVLLFPIDRVKFSVIAGAPTFKLKQVDFSGPIHPITSDDGTTVFNVPQWFDSDGNGVIDPNVAADHQYPISYTRDTKLKVSARFVASSAPPAGAQISVRVTGPGGLGATPATAAGTTITMPETEWPSAFVNQVDLYTLTLPWQVSVDGGQTWQDAGTSENKVYVTWSSPKMGPHSFLQTFVELGCDGAKGTTGVVGGKDDILVLDAIWANKFLNHSLRRATDRQMNNCIVADKRLLNYYGFFNCNNNLTTNGEPIYDTGDMNFNSTTLCTIGSPEDLVAIGNGTCGAWAEFMNAVLLAQGLDQINHQASKKVAIGRAQADGGPAFNFFAIKNWNKKGTGPLRTIPNTPTNGLDSTMNVDGLNPTALPDPATPSPNQAADAKGVDGQGNSPNPPAIFTSHFIGKFNGQYYDPSYGIHTAGQGADLIANQHAYEAAAFDGTIDNLVPGKSPNAKFLDLPKTQNVSVFMELGF